MLLLQSKLEYLRYWIIRNGITPITKKVEAIFKLTPPTKKKQLKKFIGIINYYRDLWLQRSHLLAPLITLTSENMKWKWAEEHQNAFDKMKRVMSREVLLAYPNFNEVFDIPMDS